MANKSISRLEFWTGTFLSAATIVVTILVARAEIVAEQRANLQAKASEQLGELSAAVNDAGAQLESHAGMFVEVEFCLRENRKEPESCWQRTYSFDPQRSAESWKTLDAKKASLRPYLVDSEQKFLNSFGEAKTSHRKDLKSLLPPSSPESAKSVSDRILRTKEQLEEAYAALEASISERAREK